MPKTKFQNVVFTIIMVIVMVYGMVCYNISISMGGMNNQIFLLALGELPLMGVIAFIFEFVLVERLAGKITFKVLDVKKTQPIFITIMLSALIVCFMCPLMSFFATIFFNFNGIENFIAKWLQTSILNFPMAMCWQIFYAGPLVRLIFRTIFKKQLKEAK